MNERIREMESRMRIQVTKSRDFFDGILLFGLCFFGRDDTVNERMNSPNEVANAKRCREIKEF